MNLNYYNPSDRYRNRAAQRVSAFLTVFLIMCFAGFLGFFFGKERARQEVITLKETIATMTADQANVQTEMTNLRAETHTANARYEQLKAAYEAAVPGGAASELMTMVGEQLKSGMNPDRLAFLIRSARPPENCSDPATQRFIVSTPVYKGAESLASIADGAIKIKGSGVSARNEKGDPEAWYDPSKAVSLTFTMMDGKTETKKGIMPLNHSVVHNNREYRFTISESARSFAKVTFDSCDYP